MSPVLSVVPLTSIVVEPSTPPALSVNPPAAAAVSSTSTVAVLIDVPVATESELPPETSMSTDRLYLKAGPWFTVIV